jgi:glycosyltransferase involved in cell wall biosynthesis
MEYTPFLFGARSFAPVAIGTVARMLGIPCRTIAHEIFYTRESEAVGSAAKERFFALRDRAVLANAESIFVANDERRERIVAHLPHAGARIREVAIGANVEPPPGYRRTPPEDGRIELVTFGVVMPRRRYEVAIEALAALRSAGRDARLTIVGRIFDRVYAERCRVLARSLGVERSISFAGARDASDISAIFAAGSLALSTTREGPVASSGSLLALLAHGMPILAVRGEQSDPRFADAVAYCEPAPSALAAAISGLIDRGTAELGERAVQAYRRDFDWNAIAAAMTSFGTGEERHGRVA